MNVVGVEAILGYTGLTRYAKNSSVLRVVLLPDINCCLA